MYLKRTFKPTSRNELITYCNDLSIPLWNIDTSMITDFRNVFQNPLRPKKNFEGIETWDVSSGVFFDYMFANCQNFNTSIASWVMSNAVSVVGMFENCISYNQSFIEWDTSKVVFFDRFLRNCISFNQPIDTLDTSSAVSLNYFLSGCKKFNVPITNLNLEKAESMMYFLEGASQFNQPLDTFVLSNIKRIEGFFKGCSKFNQPLVSWAKYLENITSIDEVFMMCKKLDSEIMWYLPKCKSANRAFKGCKDFRQDIGTFKCEELLEMEEMFCDAVKFKTFPIDKINVSKAYSLSGIFDNTMVSRTNFIEEKFIPSLRKDIPFTFEMLTTAVRDMEVAQKHYT